MAMKNKKQLNRITKRLKRLHEIFQRRICSEFSWTKHQFRKKRKEKEFSEDEIIKMRAIGWELANDLRRKIAN